MSYYIRKTSAGWTVAKQTFVDGEKVQKSVPREAWPTLGIKPSMDLEQAKERIRQLNIENSTEKLKQVRAVQNYKKLELLKSVYLPERQSLQFQEWLISNWDPDGSRRILWHWHTVQKLVSDVQLLPGQFNSDKQKIFMWFRKQRFSLDYSKKLLRVLNMYGEFVCELNGQFYRTIAKIPAIEAQRIRDTHLDAGRNQESGVLAPEDLERIRASLKPEQYKWLYVSVWFGLRPREIELLHSKQFGYRLEHDRALKVPILGIYQPKLVSVAREHRWKYLPVFLPEQQQALKYIKNDKLRRPLNKILKRLLGKQITCYGGRKGFIDLMLDYGQTLEDISAWLGHSSIEMSWKRYRNKKRVSFRPLKAG